MASHNYGLEGIGSNVELGKTGPRVKDNAGVIEFRNQADDAFAKIRAADPVDDDDVATKRFVETHSSLRVTGQIDGGSPPSPGTVGRVFIVTTAGGSYALKELYRDSGAAWVQIPVTEGMRITITDDLTGGTDEYAGDHLYLWDEDAGEWVDVGPVYPSDYVKTKKVTLNYSQVGNNNVGTPVPDNSIIIKTKVAVTQIFDGSGPLLKIGDATDDDRHMETKHTKLDKVGIYWVENYYDYGSATQIVANLAAPGATQGQLSIIIEYAPK